jgi:hypothetical protein
MDQKHAADFFTREEAIDMMGIQVKKLTRDTFGGEKGDERMQPGSPGEVIRIEHHGDNLYGIGVAWGKPGKPRLVAEYNKLEFQKEAQLVRDRGIEHDR